MSALLAPACPSVWRNRLRGWWCAPPRSTACKLTFWSLLAAVVALFLRSDHCSPSSPSAVGRKASSRPRSLTGSSVNFMKRIIKWLPLLGTLVRARGLSQYSAQHLDNDLTSRDVSVQLFQWNYNDIAAECENHIGPAGYRYIQVSPPQEHVMGHEWWTDYQPVSYRIGSKRGSESELADMVRRCEASGVGVIADAVINHMTGGNASEIQRGVLGTEFRKYEYPGTYTRSDFHNCHPYGDNVISNFSNRYELQNCELLGLADLDTGKTRVQQQIQSYLNRLVDLGIKGVRLDASKHIATDDIWEITKDIPLRLVQEVIFGPNEEVQPEEYVPNGRVHIFRGASDLKRMFLVDGITYLGKPIPWGYGWGRGYLPSSHSQVFVTNWDLEREQGHTVLQMQSEPVIYKLAQTFLLTWNYGQVDVFSGYNYTAQSNGPIQTSVECGRYGWRCEHRDPMIVGAVRIRSASTGEPVSNIITSGKQRLAFNRGSKAFLAFNNEDYGWLLDGLEINLKAPPRADGRPFLNLLSATGDPEVVDVRYNAETQNTFFGQLTIPPRSAVGILA